MSEFAELGKLMDGLRTLTSTVDINVYHSIGMWGVDVTQTVCNGKGVERIVVATATEYSLDTALSLVLQDLRDMANE